MKQSERAGKSSPGKKLQSSQDKKEDNKFQTIIECAPEAFFQGNNKGNLITVNNKAVELTGYSKEELLSMNMSDLFADNVLNEYPLKYDLLKNGVTIKSEREIIRKDGNKKYVEMNSNVMPDGTYLSFFRDITERKIAEEEIKVSESRLKRAEIASKSGNWELHLDNQIIYGSTGAAKIYGIDKDKIDYSVIKTVSLPEYRQMLDLALKNLIEKNEPYDVEFKIKAIDSGEIKDIHSIAEFDKEKRILFGAIQDITDRKKVEEELIKQKEKAEENETIFSELFRLSPNALSISTINTGEIIKVNKNFIEIFGYDEDEAVGKLSSEINLWVNYSERDKLFKKISKDGYLSNVELKLRNKKGEILDIESSVSIVKIENKQMILSSFIDITSRKKAEIELRKAKERAEQSDRLKTEFLNNMSHEIRTPLNGILGFTNSLNENITDEERQYYINIINNCSDQLLRIIDDILEISRLETKQVKIIESKVCLNLLLLQLFSIFDIKAKEVQIPLYLEKGLNDNQSTIFTDELKLIKILSNLLENALKFTNKGCITLGYKLDENNLKIYVKDTGIGIKEQNHKIIFERFSQEENTLSGKVSGLGLGLSIAMENAHLLGGAIDLVSEKGKGSAFTVTIPYKPVDMKVTSNISTKPIPKSLNDFTILIVEDDEINFLYFETSLNSMVDNLRIIHAKNGKEAVNLCNQEKIDLIFMDLKMPVMDGYTAAKQISKKNSKIPIIAQTAYASEDDKNKVLSMGFHEYLAKPIKKESLYQCLMKYKNNSF